MSSPDRVVLEGVPRVHFYEGGDECPEDITFPSCLRAWLQYMGDGYGCKLAPADAADWRPGCGYAYLVGLTGLGFWLRWDQAGDEGVGCDAMLMAEDPREPVRRALDAVGHEHDILLKPDFLAPIAGERPAPQAGGCDEAQFRTRVIESLRAGRPVIAFGVAGPPEACLVTGYDEGGDVLIGWSFFQGDPGAAGPLEFESSGQFRKRHWFPDTSGLLLISERGQKPPVAEAHRRALEWAIQVMRTPEVRGRPSGLRAYRAWFESVREDANFASLDEEALGQHYRRHDLAVGFVAEARWYGSLFLRQVASQRAHVSHHLNSAADCFVAEHDLMWAVWEFARHGEPHEHPRRFAQPWIRQRINPLLRLAWQQDEQAAAYIEEALAGW